MKSKSGLLQMFLMIKNRIPVLLLMTVSNSAVSVLSVLFALGSKNIINNAISGQWSSFRQACVIQLFLIIAILSCFLLSRYLKERFTCVVDRDFKRIFLKSILSSQYSKASVYHSGELINRASNDIRILTEGIFATVPGAVSMITRIAVAFFALLNLEKRFALFIFVAGICIIFFTALMRRGLKELNKRVSKADGAVTSFFQEIFEKLIVVQAMGAHNEIGIRADRLLEERFAFQMKRKNASLFANMSVSFMSYASSFAALVWCSVGIMNATTTFGDMTAVLQLVSQLQNPVANLSGIIPQYVAMLSAWERLNEIFTIEKSDSTNSADTSKLYGETDYIGCRNLTFTYDREVVFDDAGFEIEKGSFVLIKGSSGIGKSTLLKLMLGIYEPEKGVVYLKNGIGEVLLDGSNRNILTYVPQGNLLLSGTIRENLLLAHPDADEKMIEKAVYVSCMDEYLPLLPDGLDTVLSENGGGLSEGQAQRIAIARAVLSSAPMLLLDEITSALDSETESTVLRRLKGLENVTCFVVTHRAISEELYDGILEINNGKIFHKQINNNNQGV